MHYGHMWPPMEALAALMSPTWEKRVALEDFATRDGCWTCNLPAEILKEINEARRNAMGTSKTCGPDAVVAWLIAEKGYKPEDTLRGSINHHFLSNHHVR